MTARNPTAAPAEQGDNESVAARSKGIVVAPSGPDAPAADTHDFRDYGLLELKRDPARAWERDQQREYLAGGKT